MKKKKSKRRLTSQELLLFNEEHKKFVTENFQLGRKVVLNEDFYGIKKGTDGLVIDTWPTTSILFRYFYNDITLSIDLSEILEFHEVYEGTDFDEYYDTLSASSFRKVTRKTVYTDE